MTILVTGGAGYIGSHCCIALIEAGYDIVVVDNFSNSSPESLARVRSITGKQLKWEAKDVRDRESLEKILLDHKCSGVFHFAGLKAVGESCTNPIEYYSNNVVGTLELLSAMKACSIFNFVFSSSATVYGNPRFLPLTEEHPVNAVNPYGRTKQMVENVLSDLTLSDSRWKVAILRYFNPVGAHESGQLGEDPRGVPTNLMPFITQVATGRRNRLRVFGNDYDTRDGTGVRDYVHVVDLADGHLLAYRRVAECSEPDNCLIVNLGTGVGYSVLELVKAFEGASGKSIPFDIVDRRPGDIAECFASTERAAELLKWSASRGLAEMCRDSWNWACKNPNGLWG